MKKIYTILLMGALSLPLANNVSAITIEPEPISNVNRVKVFFVDKKDDGNIGYSNNIEKGSRIYGYLYDTQTKYPNFNVTIPEGMCITNEGLPTILPHLTHHTDTISKPNDFNVVTNVSAKTIIDDTKSDDHINLNPIINIKDDASGKLATFKDGSTMYLYSDKTPFYYSVDNGQTWVNYKNRDDANIPNDCSITDFKIEGHTSYISRDTLDQEYPAPSIFTYNMTVKADNVNTFNPGTADKLGDINGVPTVIQGEQPSVSYVDENSIAPRCETLPIDISIEKEKVEEKPTLPSAPTSSGPGGYTPTEPTKTETIKPIERVEPTNPIIVNKCQNIVKNLDDAKLIEYYKKLQVETGLNVHGDISRLDLIRLAVNAGYLTVDENEDITVLNDFADVAKNSWYAKYVAKLVKKDLLSLEELANNEKNLKLFGTNDYIKREDAVKILANIITEKNLRLPTLNEIITFSDVKTSDKNSDYIQYAYDSCLLHGRKTLDGQPIGGKPRVFEGWSNITIAETAKILYNGQDIRK